METYQEDSNTLDTRMINYRNYGNYSSIQFEMMMQLGDYMQQGIPLFFENRPCTPAEVINAMMVREDEVYMADFVRDDNGHLLQIRYDHIDV